MKHLPPEIIDAALLIIGYLCRWIIDKFKKDKKVIQLTKENERLVHVANNAKKIAKNVIDKQIKKSTD